MITRNLQNYPEQFAAKLTALERQVNELERRITKLEKK